VIEVAAGLALTLPARSYLQPGSVIRLLVALMEAGNAVVIPVAAPPVRLPKAS
jgi:hypothetical protein